MLFRSRLPPPAASRRPPSLHAESSFPCLNPSVFPPKKWLCPVPPLCPSISCRLNQCTKGDSNSLQGPTPLTSQACTHPECKHGSGGPHCDPRPCHHPCCWLRPLKVEPWFWGLQLRLGHIGVSLGRSDLLSCFCTSQPGGRPDGPLSLGPSSLGADGCVDRKEKVQSKQRQNTPK